MANDPVIINGNMGQFPVGADYSSWQSQLDYARGRGADFVGQPYDVYRVADDANGDYIQESNRIYQNFPLQRKQLKTGAGAETSKTQGTFLYSMLGDLALMQVGDVYVQNDPAYGIGQTLSPFAEDEGVETQFDGVCEASHAPLKKSIGARVDRLVTVFRLPNPIDDEDDPYNRTRLINALPLRCEDGTWVLGDVDEAAHKIPAGFMTTPKNREPMIKDEPNATASTNWMVFIPLLRGFQILEGDRIVSYDGSRYEVIHPYEQQAGLMGHQLICQREVIG